MSIDEKVDGAKQASDGKPDHRVIEESSVELTGEAKLSSMFAQAKSSTTSRYVPPHSHYHRRRHYSK